jgi:dihydroorotase
METTGWAVATIIRGNIVMRDGALVAAGGGQPIQFVETLKSTP